MSTGELVATVVLGVFDSWVIAYNLVLIGRYFG